MTLNNTERRTGCYFALFYRKRDTWLPITSQWFESHPYKM